MINKTENMLRYEKMHDDCREIFKEDKDIDSKLKNFNDYLISHLDSDDNGTMRTLLVIGKPFKNNPIVKDNLEFLADRLRKKLNVDFI